MMSTLTKPKPAILGILGGVGPAAGVLLHQIILKNTNNRGTDQGHFDTIHMSRSSDVPDRTEFLMQQQEGENPAMGMVRTVDMMMEAATSRGGCVVAGVPCNTFHAAAIWNKFAYTTERKHDGNIKLVHMLEETLEMIATVSPDCQNVGLMSTTGTRQSRVYHELLEKRGYKVIEVDENLQPDLHDTIYNEDWGIKSTAPMVAPKAIQRFHSYAASLANEGAEVIIMGCTEIPFAFVGQQEIQGVRLIDPIEALGRAMIRLSDASKLKPLLAIEAGGGPMYARKEPMNARGVVAGATIRNGPPRPPAGGPQPRWRSR